ncbi:hypothetical protein [Piscinibacter sp. XHJ-5]|uniref:hypothetical protein n=1 Tax=Piscinibacter sp. XHJ-5 TaxID=3037797 RepID=UPI0024532C56|nr:hypothetical protein [Piscinibacter sp. XHJ-5]
METNPKDQEASSNDGQAKTTETKLESPADPASAKGSRPLVRRNAMVLPQIAQTHEDTPKPDSGRNSGENSAGAWAAPAKVKGPGKSKSLELAAERSGHDPSTGKPAQKRSSDEVQTPSPKTRIGNAGVTVAGNHSIQKPLVPTLTDHFRRSLLKIATEASQTIESKKCKKLSARDRYINMIYFALGGTHVSKDCPEAQEQETLVEALRQDEARLLLAQHILALGAALDSSTRFFAELALLGGVPPAREWCETELGIKPGVRTWFGEVHDFYKMMRIADMASDAQLRLDAVIQSAVRKTLAEAPTASKERVLADVTRAVVQTKAEIKT